MLVDGPSGVLAPLYSVYEDITKSLLERPEMMHIGRSIVGMLDDVEADGCGQPQQDVG